ncbi:hypothetical protein GDO78_002643 [Eleutherodactylus coqui]|uniref:Endoplasmic reticulum junction formation protein lunapark n=2 Tax=Eleutherodactylus coqui TaxID=57060 RepID=A0A8J6EYJ2_ELECQ|nr:hypothetical protein GDO78_002643 [Eleutherodactylus coqui]
MGALLSRWKAKPSTVELLEKMEKEIGSLEEFQEKNQKLRKIWIKRLLAYSTLFYLLTCFIVYLWYLPDGLTTRLLLIIPFLLFPVIIWCTRSLLIILFSRRTERNNEALEDLKAQKKKIELESSASVPNTPRPGQDLRQRTAAQRNISVSTPVNPSQGTPQVPGMLAATPGLQRDTSAPGGPPERTLQPGLQSGLVPRRPGSPATAISGMAIHPPGPPLARPILPRERGAVDRVIEYLVGDGPQNRYALICQQCFSHNGMALREEFEYVAFRCAYCFFLNPARKTRPQAPRLQEFNLERMPRSDSQIATSTLQAATEELENQTSSSSDQSEAGETPDAEEVVAVEEKNTEELSDDAVKEADQALPEETVPPASVNENEESFMETE